MEWRGSTCSCLRQSDRKKAWTVKLDRVSGNCRGCIVFERYLGDKYQAVVRDCIRSNVDHDKKSHANISWGSKAVHSSENISTYSLCSYRHGGRCLRLVSLRYHFRGKHKLVYQTENKHALVVSV